jgi:hypothetical protein
MKLPYVCINVNANGNLNFSHFTTNPDDPLEVEHSLSDLNGRGFEDTSQSIGRTVLALMGNWFPDVMRQYPSLAVPYDDQDDLNLLQMLISRSARERTTVHFPSIDTIVAQVVKGNPNAITHSVISTWPDIRKNIAERAHI